MSKIINKFYIITFLVLIFSSISVFIYFYNDNYVKNYLTKKINQTFKLEKLKLDGRYRSNRSKILNQLSLEKGSPILFIDLEDLRKKILTVPWVKTAKVSRKLPNEIHISIAEYQPAAIWEYKKEIYVLNDDGYQIEKVNKRDGYEDLLFAVGEEANINISNLLLALNDFPSLNSRIDFVRFIGKRRWDIYLKGDVRILLPMGDVIDAITELNQHLKDYNLIEKGHKKIDLRVKGEISTDRIFKN